MPQVIIDGISYVPMPEPLDVEGLKGALQVRFDSDAGENLTVREYFCALLERLWDFLVVTPALVAEQHHVSFPFLSSAALSGVAVSSISDTARSY